MALLMRSRLSRTLDVRQSHHGETRQPETHVDPDTGQASMPKTAAVAARATYPTGQATAPWKSREFERSESNAAEFEKVHGTPTELCDGGKSAIRSSCPDTDYTEEHGAGTNARWPPLQGVVVSLRL